MATLEDRIEEHLASKGTTLFGRSFDIQSEEGMDRAVDWFAKHMRAVISLRAGRDSA